MQTIINEEDIGFDIEPRICRAKAKQYDTERILKFTLISDLSPVDMSDISHIYWREKFADNTVLPPVEIDMSNLTNSGTLLTVKLTRDMLYIPGVAKCDIVFIKGDYEPNFDLETYELLDPGQQVLSTQIFELYIEPTAYQDGTIDYLPDGAETFNDLITLVVAMQQAVKDERERVRAEQERVAREGKGTYSNYEFRIGYTDVNGQPQYIDYQDSRVGRNERNKALNEGGYYIDESGNLQHRKNEYKDTHNVTHTADLTDIEDMSFMAVAAMAKDIAGDPTYALLAESHSHGETGVRNGEATDNSRYWSEQAAASAQIAQTAAQQVEDLTEGTLPSFTYDSATGHLYYTGSTIDLSVNSNDGHLYWLVEPIDTSFEANIADLTARIIDLENSLNLQV